MMRPRLAFLLAASVALAGCAASGEHDQAGALDTGPIPPGDERTLTFSGEAPIALHCDPHPFMTHDVTFAADAPLTAHVHIHDGNATDAYRFEPASLVVAPGAQVAYHNHGALLHTASEMTTGMSH